MRVTSQGVFLQVNSDIQQAYRRVATAQESITTGRRINHWSDDPLGAVRVLQFRSFLSSLDQYEKNAQRVLPSFNQGDSVLNDAEDILARAKELALSSANDTQSASARADTAVEVHQLRQQLLDLANTKVEGNFIFAGFKSTTAPFSESAGTTTYAGDSGVLQIQIGSGSSIASNLPGDQVFQGVGLAAGTDIFDTLGDLETALTSNDVTGPDGIQAQIDRLDKGNDQLLSFRAQFSARINNIQAALDSLAALKIQNESQRSQIEDADMLQAYSDFTRYQQAFEATLNSAAQVIQPSLMDFLR